MDLPNPTPKKRLSCPQCTKSYTTNENLHNHIRNKHKDLQKAFMCSSCNQTFNYQADCKRHEQHKHGAGPAKGYVCGNLPEHNSFGCGKAFARRDFLPKHRLARKGVCTKKRWKRDEIHHDASPASTTTSNVLTSTSTSTIFPTLQFDILDGADQLISNEDGSGYSSSPARFVAQHNRENTDISSGLSPVLLTSILSTTENPRMKVVLLKDLLTVTEVIHYGGEDIQLKYQYQYLRDHFRITSHDPDTTKPFLYIYPPSR